jgi:hypothetical protein
MSIDIEILPGSAARPSWREVKDMWRDLVGSEFASEIDAATLHPLGGGPPLPEKEAAQEGAFEVRLRTRSTLLLTTMPTAGTFDETTYLEDYGRNLDPPTFEEIRRRWTAAGWFHQISSLGGRPPHELRVMVALATALARATHGWVVISQQVFGVGVGVYSPDELTQPGAGAIA